MLDVEGENVESEKKNFLEWAVEYEQWQKSFKSNVILKWEVVVPLYTDNVGDFNEVEKILLGRRNKWQAQLE